MTGDAMISEFLIALFAGMVAIATFRRNTPRAVEVVVEGDPVAVAIGAFMIVGLTPLTATDVAEVIAFAVSRPAHVNLDSIVLKPRDQHSATRAYRR